MRDIPAAKLTQAVPAHKLYSKRAAFVNGEDAGRSSVP